jgi:tRNA U34 5-methylaminomethyl-2-thiouridine-forming methyltransferase MnmC
MTINRQIVATRRMLGETLTREFRPLEESADATAVKGFRFLALTLEQRAQAALPVVTGTEAIELLYSACQRAYEAQAQLRQAHALWPEIVRDTEMFAPECDPKGESVPFKIVA